MSYVVSVPNGCDAQPINDVTNNRDSISQPGKVFINIPIEREYSDAI